MRPKVMPNPSPSFLDELAEPPVSFPELGAVLNGVVELVKECVAIDVGVDVSLVYVVSAVLISGSKG